MVTRYFRDDDMLVLGRRRLTIAMIPARTTTTPAPVANGLGWWTAQVTAPSVIPGGGAGDEPSRRAFWTAFRQASNGDPVQVAKQV